MGFSSAEIATLNSVVDRLRSHPELLEDATLDHFRAYLHSIGANVRLHPHRATPSDASSDPDLWVADDLAKYRRLPQEPVDPENEEITEKANTLKGEAQGLANDGMVEEALAKITQALELRPASSMWWALRADYHLRLKRPLAAIEDATEALRRNPDSARALRVRGLANRHLGEWESANEDLNTAQRIDFSDSIVDVIKVVETKCKELREQRRAAEEERQRALRQQRAEEEAEAQSHSQSQPHQHEHHHHHQQAPPFGGMPSGFPMGGMPSGFPMGGMPAGGIPPGFETLLQDPEVAHALQDPEVMMKLGSLMSNPGLMPQMLADPKIGPIMQRIMSRVNSGGMGPGMGMGGMPTSAGAAAAPPPPTSSGGTSKPTVNTDLD